MEKYNYLKAVKEDVLSFIENEITLSDYEDRKSLEDYLNDELFCSDYVTGNASGSYTFDSYTAKEYLRHNEDLLSETAKEFGDVVFLLNKRDEVRDVTIRCYLLRQAIAEVLDNMELPFEE